MRGEKEVESAAVPIHNWLLMITYLGKSTLFHNRQDERLKLVVSSPAKTHPQEYMYAFEVGSLAECDFRDAKDFKTLKELYYYLKFNGESVRFREVTGEGRLSVQYPNTKKEKPIAHIAGGLRFVAEHPDEKKRRVQRIQQEERETKEQMERQAAEKEEPAYDPATTLVVDRIEDIVIKKQYKLSCEPTEFAKAAKKIVLRYCQMDVNSPQCEMKNDREVDRLAMQTIYKVLPDLTNLEELSIQWHKLNTSKAIQELLTACQKLEKLRVLAFDNQGNVFDNSFFAKINQASALKNLEEVSCFFNISDEDDYFEESWWHPEHTEKYKGKDPILAVDWQTFASAHPGLNSVWIPKNGKDDTDLLGMRNWKKLALGYYEDQQMQEEYWNAVKEMFPLGRNMDESLQHRLTSLCLTRIKDIDNTALAGLILTNSGTLEHFALSWCDSESEEGLAHLGKCERLRSVSLRHSPLQENNRISCSFLRSQNMRSLQSLCVQNFKLAKDNVLNFLASEQSSNLRSLSLPRNEWVGEDTWGRLGDRKQLIKLNLYNTKLLSKEKGAGPVIDAIGSLRALRVLNLGATDLELLQLKSIVERLPRLRKLNISDRRTGRNMNRAFYDGSWNIIEYPEDEIDKGGKKAYEKLDNNEKKEFLARITNKYLTEILKCTPRVTHLDIRNLGGDERPFADLKLVPSLRFVGCEFQLYKQIQALQRRGVTFV